MPSALDVLDGEVRELIRDVVADYSERSLTSALPPIGDPEGVVRDVLAGDGTSWNLLEPGELGLWWTRQRRA